MLHVSPGHTVGVLHAVQAVKLPCPVGVLSDHRGDMCHSQALDFEWSSGGGEAGWIWGPVWHMVGCWHVIGQGLQSQA